MEREGCGLCQGHHFTRSKFEEYIELPCEWGSTFPFFRIRYITSQQRPNIIPQLNIAIDIIMVFLNSSLLASNNPVERSTSNGSLETCKTRKVGTANDFSQEKKEG